MKRSLLIYGAMPSLNPSHLHDHLTGRPGSRLPAFMCSFISDAEHCQQLVSLPLTPSQVGIHTGACSCPLRDFTDAIQSMRWPSFSGSTAL